MVFDCSLPVSHSALLKNAIRCHIRISDFVLSLPLFFPFICICFRWKPQLKVVSGVLPHFPFISVFRYLKGMWWWLFYCFGFCCSYFLLIIAFFYKYLECSCSRVTKILNTFFDASYLLYYFFTSEKKIFLVYRN